MNTKNIFFIFTVLIFISSLSANKVLSLTKADLPKNPLYYGDLSSPRATLYGFIENFEFILKLLAKKSPQEIGPRRSAIMIERILHHLDLSQIPPNLRLNYGKEAAVYLIEVLARLKLPPAKIIPGKKDLYDNDGHIRLKTYRLPKTEIIISLIKEGDQKGLYRFSTQTVQNARRYYDLVRYLPYQNASIKGALTYYLSYPSHSSLAFIVSSLPEWWLERYNSVARWQWIMIFISIIFAVILGLLVIKTTRILARKTKYLLAKNFYWLINSLVLLAIPRFFRHFTMEELRITGSTLEVIIFSCDILFLSIITYVLLSFFSRLGEIVIASPQVHPQGLDAQVIRLISRLVGFVVAFVVFLEGGKTLGIPLTTLLAGAGVGGLTLALAAQDTLKNIFGSMMIVLDKPYRVGERIKVKGYDGFVEEIGLRSTRIRLLNGHLTAIPNEIMAANDIENVGRRPYILKYLEVQLNIEDPLDKAENAVKIITKLLENHEGMMPGKPARVFLSDLTRDWYVIKVFFWYTPPNYWKFLNFCQTLITTMMNKFEENNIRLAVPISKTVLSREQNQATK